MTPITPDQVKEIGLQLLPAFAPIIIDMIKKLAPGIEQRLPWFLKPIASAVLGALIGLLTDATAGAGSGAAGLSTGIGASLAYMIAREKEPKGSGGIRKAASKIG